MISRFLTLIIETNDSTNCYNPKHVLNVPSQRAHTSTVNALKTRFQDIQNVNSESVYKT